MKTLSRRSIIRGSVALAAAGSIGRPYVANAAAKTAHVWWSQGFVREEDDALKSMVAAYEKASGNVIDLSIVPFGPLMQKIVSALTSGDVPDLLTHPTAANNIDDSIMIEQLSFKSHRFSPYRTSGAFP